MGGLLWRLTETNQLIWTANLLSLAKRKIIVALGLRIRETRLSPGAVVTMRLREHEK